MLTLKRTNIPAPKWPCLTEPKPDKQWSHWPVLSENYLQTWLSNTIHCQSLTPCLTQVDTDSGSWAGLKIWQAKSTALWKIRVGSPDSPSVLKELYACTSQAVALLLGPQSGNVIANQCPCPWNITKTMNGESKCSCHSAQVYRIEGPFARSVLHMCQTLQTHLYRERGSGPWHTNIHIIVLKGLFYLVNYNLVVYSGDIILQHQLRYGIRCHEKCANSC